MTVDNTNPKFNLSSVARSTWCLALIDCCSPHVLLESDERKQEFGHWQKAVSKLRAFLAGELKSDANLERFYQAFSDWEATYETSDSLNGRITALVFSATHTAVAALFDEDSDDTQLIRGNIDELHQELGELGGDMQGLSQYWQELDAEWSQKLRDIQQRPVAAATLKEVLSTDVSIFGLSS